jgi:hypothetical protein
MDNFKKEIEKAENYVSSAENINITIDEITHQLKLLSGGIEIPKLVRPCTIDDGVLKLDNSDNDELLKAFTSASLEGRITKFVPASGAASRMFHKLHSVLLRFKDLTFNDLEKYSETDAECKRVFEFLSNLEKFAFYQDLKRILNNNDDEIRDMVSKFPSKLLDAVLYENGLNYSARPKAAIKFHLYIEESRTAFEEQIFESLQYAIDKSNRLRIHFTISQEHTELFDNLIKEVKQKLADTDFKIDVSYSYQKKHTDAIAVKLNNEIIYDSKGNLLRRPGGHGALLENLDELNGDIIIIKNIDNVCVEKLNSDSILYKKLLVGLLVKIQKKVFGFLESLNNPELYDVDYNEIMTFSKKYLSLEKPEKFDSWEIIEKNKFLFEVLNRPIRVCGMVKNEGEPGGGPFWVEDADGKLSLQIIEQAQVNMQDENQKSIFKQSTHFNPVDLVCGVRDYKGNSFNLMKFVDEESGIVVNKSKHGVEIKALELPGLWNGSMAYWNTIFVEVPISTFNPVKEVNDLLKPMHQN